ncbi:type II secretion system F family protein [Anaerotalea alkaliphila]|uniref:Type II secretion system protein GspF domain-containing protein n=1 Tax=Anaerotalea alkaliphila TaxID=2662126 RepID=A0A7X5KLH0_9FIRM|nr:type II secretion system F family protein [Anaerotalea alkaliphila]NDL66694.1 hypothetical protein [Anaerotalea alkaliphila]
MKWRWLDGTTAVGERILCRMPWKDRLTGSPIMKDMVQSAYGEDGWEENLHRYLAEVLGLGVAGAGLAICLVVCLQVAAWTGGQGELQEGQLVKGSLSEGTRFLELEYETEWEGMTIEDRLQLELEPHVDSEAMLRAYLLEVAEGLGDGLPGGDESLEGITGDLSLPSRDATGRIGIRWESGRQDLLTNRGEVLKSQTISKGTEVGLTAILMAEYNGQRIQEEKAWKLVFGEIRRSPEEYRKWISKELRDFMEQENTLSTGRTVLLPEAVLGEAAAISYGNGGSKALAELGNNLLGAIFFGIAVALVKSQELKTVSRKRKAAMGKRFPELLRSLTLLINAGMTVRQALDKVCRQGGEATRENPFVSELRLALEEWQMGKTEKELFEALGRRCQTKEVQRFAGILLQGMQKGNGNMVEQLDSLARDAWNDKIGMARKEGEKASSKLVLPMGILLCAIILIVMTPTFASIGF